MSSTRARSDLIVVVADLDAQNVVQALLSRRESLGIRTITRQTYRFIKRDAGCFRDVHEYLRPFVKQFDYALVVFDRHGCGAEHLPRQQLEDDVEQRLARNGWSGRSAAIVIDPKLEAWVWSDSPEVDRTLGFENKSPKLREWLRQENLWPPETPKPSDPKQALRCVLRYVAKSWSAAVFRQLAERVSLRRCRDPAFLKLKQTLRRWFSN